VIPVARDLLRIPSVIGQHALWRSAAFFQGQRFADYILFLNERIPQRARVILPPTQDSENKMLGTTPTMQFYLAPRQVVNCPDLDCLGSISPENTYLVVTDPSQLEFTNNFNQVQKFDQKWGLASSRNTSSSSSTPLPAFNSYQDITGSALLPLAWLMILTCTGLLLVSYLLPDLPLFARAALGYGVSTTGLTVLIGLAMLVGVQLGTNLILGISALLIIIAVIIRLSLRHKPTVMARTSIRSKANLPDTLWLAALTLLGLLAVSISIGESYHTTDAILLWGAKGYGLASTGVLKSVVNWGTNTVPYPLHIPLLIASMKTLFMERLPASKLVYPGYYLGLLMLVYQALLQAKLRRVFARIMILLVATSPLVFRHATIGYANLALSFYLVAGVVLLQRALNDEEESGSNNTLLLMSGFYFAAAAWSRPEGLPLSWAGIVLALSMKLPGQPSAKSLKKLVFLIVPMLLYTLFWYWLNSQVYVPTGITNDLVGNGLSQVLSGNLHPSGAGYLARSLITRLINVKTWGLLGILVLVSLPFSLFKSIRAGRAGSLTFYLGLLWIGMISGMYFLASYDPRHDISWWVSTGLDRMLLPGILLSLLGGLSLVEALDNREEATPSTYPE